MTGRYSLANAYHNWPHWEAKVLGRKALSRRGRIVGHALYSVKFSSATFPSYTEDVNVRGQFLDKPRGTYPIDTDCSGHATWGYWMSHAPDPSGLDYQRLGFTGTILSHAHTISTNPATARPGDLITVGPGNGDHVYTCVKAGPNPLCASHGSPGVELVRLLDDARLPRRVCVSL